MRKQFKDTVTDISINDDKVIVVVGDISGYLFKDYEIAFPQRFFNMGICENTLISVTAGLSAQGFFPFVHTIAPFLTERSYEQIKLDMCYNQFGGNIVTCGASFDYAWDGATHHCYTDLAIFRMLPGMEVIQPGSKKETDLLIRSQYNNGKPTYFRLSDRSHTFDLPVEFGKGSILKDVKSQFTIVTAGPIAENVMQGCADLNVNILYFHTIKPIDKALLQQFSHTKIMVVHDAFGLHEAVNEIPYLQTQYIGLPDEYCVWYGTVEDIRAKIGLDANAIRERIQLALNDK